MANETPEIEWGAGDRKGYRLHPLALVVDLTRYGFALVASALVLFSSGETTELWIAVGLIPAAIFSVVRFFSFRYLLTDTHLVIREGVLFKKTRSIPFERIQNIDTVRRPYHLPFRAAQVRLETAGGQEPEAVFKVLALERVEEIRRGITPRVVPTEVAERVVQTETPLHRMRLGDVVLFGLLSQKGLAYLAGALFLVYEFDLLDRFRPLIAFELQSLERPSLLVMIVTGILLAFVLQVATVFWGLVTLFGFKVVQAGSDLRTTCGLWTRQSATLPKARIQVLQIEQSLMKRMMNRVSIRAISAGGDSTSESQISRKWIAPLLPEGDAYPFLRRIQPGIGVADEAWLGVHAGARRRLTLRWTLALMVPVGLASLLVSPWSALGLPLVIPLGRQLAKLRVKRLRYAVSGDVVALRDGYLGQKLSFVRFSKVQTVRLRQTPWDRRLRMATVSVDTAGAAGALQGFEIPFLELGVARALQLRLATGASRYEFRW